jgi:hypothetical protein
MMVPQMYKGIALGQTGNLQGTVKFYCLNTGPVLKHCSFTPLPMPDRVIKQVNTIGLKEKQRRSFRFLNRRQRPYKWTNEVPKEDLKFQGLLEVDKEEAAACPDISVELPVVELMSKDDDYTVITEEQAVNFQDLAAVALDNAGMDTVAWLRAARNLANTAAMAPKHSTAALIEANKDRIVYKITFNLPNAGLGTHIEPPIPPANATEVDKTGYDPLVGHEPAPITSREPIAHCTRSQAPRMSFLHLGEVQTHRVYWRQDNRQE